MENEFYKLVEPSLKDLKKISEQMHERYDYSYAKDVTEEMAFLRAIDYVLDLYS